MQPTTPNIKDLSREELIEWLAGAAEPPYRAGQIGKWLFQRRASSFAAMTDLPAPLRDRLAEEFSISSLPVLQHRRSQDGTEKFLFGLADGLAIESVLIPESRRLTLCISSQVGCGLGCAFCATAKMGLKRNLRSSEILDQVLEVQKTLPTIDERRITNVVWMGMGEPLANYEQTRRALNVMTDADYGIGFSPRRITLSTVGLVPQIQRLMAETHVNLAVSLHAADDRVRGSLMPINRKYPLHSLIECCRELPLPKRKRITFEYVLLQGVNHSPQDAEKLARLLKGIRCKLNLIPFNPHESSPYRRPDSKEIEEFAEKLRARGFQVNIRQPRGDDIEAACGQLYAEAKGTALHGSGSSRAAGQQGTSGPERRAGSRHA